MSTLEFRRLAWRCQEREKIFFHMDQTQTNWIAGFIWGIADDVLRDFVTTHLYAQEINAEVRELKKEHEPAENAWYASDKVKSGYETSSHVTFTSRSRYAP